MKRKYLKWAMVLAWMIVIFVFSGQNGDDSSSNNRFIVDMFKSIGINLDSVLGSQVNFIIRKLAHMTEYFVLFMLIYNALKIDVRFGKNLMISIIIVFLYASSDEIHQSFVPGRACMFRDVMIDTAGAGVAMLGTIIVTYKKRSTLKKRHLLKAK